MTDLQFTYNLNPGLTAETKVEFLWDNQKHQWDIHINNFEEDLTLSPEENDEDGLHYDLYKNDTCIRTFNFDGQTVRYLPNLMKVYMVVMDNTVGNL